jgi:hypothetical protein
MSNTYIGEGSYSITPSNTKDLDYPGATLFVQGAGDVHFIGMNGMEDTITLTAGALLPVRVKKLYSTGTTATGIHGILG